jgi:hypothetical protein
MTRARRLAALVAAVALASPPLGAFAPATAAAQGRASVRGVVHDSLAAAPLAGATIQLAAKGDLRGARTTVADSLGRYAFDAVTAGAYVIGFVHPHVVALGIDMPVRAVHVPDGATVRADLALPAGPTLRRALCASTGADARDSSGAISGVLRDADSGHPIDGAVVTVSWRELRLDGGRLGTGTRRVPARTGPGGVYLVCGAPSGVELTMRAVARAAGRASRASGAIPAHVPLRGLLRRDVLLADSAAPADARLTGTVHDAAGTPVAGAAVTVRDAAAQAAATSAAGAFRLDGLPRGSHTLEVRAVGYAPARVAVSLTRDTTATAAVVLSRSAPALDRVVVRDRAERTWADHEGFLARRRSHIGGAFLTLADLERRRGVLATDALGGVRGLQVHPAADGVGRVVRGRGGCRPDVYIDGTHVSGGADEVDRLVTPNDLFGVEVYGGPGDTPAEFVPPFGGGCGAVVIWTKR